MQENVMKPIDHFLRLAKRGASPGASGGEKRAFRLAKAVVEDLPGLDNQAVAGFGEFAIIAYSKPMTAGDMLGCLIAESREEGGA
jgi:hypothetical protein